MRQWIGSALVQIMACGLFGAKPLPKPMLGYCQLDPQEQISVKFESNYKALHSRKCIWKYRLRNGAHFVQGWWVNLCFEDVETRMVLFDCRVKFGGSLRRSYIKGNVRFCFLSNYIYRQVSNTRRTKSQHLKYSRTVLRLSLPNPLKPDVKSRMKM